jgi:hypothetical protein
MKRSNESRLHLEVLEERLALNGTFRGAIDAAPPSLTPFPFNGLTVHTTTLNLAEPGYRGSFANVTHPTFAPAPASQGQLPSLPAALSFQSQLQSFQAAQTAMMDQLFSEMAVILQSFQFNASTLGISANPVFFA